jgi:hypothetical protein
MTQTFRESGRRPDGTPNFAISDWLLTPAPWRVDQPPTPDQQLWLLVLTGIVLTDFQGQTSDNWREDTLELIPDNAVRDALRSVRQPPPNSNLAFQVLQWAPSATVNTIFDAEVSVNAGYGVDEVTPILVNPGGPQPIPNQFGGLAVKAVVRDSDAFLLRVGYYVTLLGRIVDVPILP